MDDRPLLDVIETTYQSHLALARRFVGDDDAADVVQEAYVRAWRAFPRFRGEAAVSTWLHTIITNTARTWIGRRRATVALDDTVEPPDAHPSGDPSRRAEVALLRTELAAALERLPVTFRQVVVLKDVVGLTHDQIGRELGITATAAKVRLHRARRELRALLQAPALADVA